MFEQAFKNIDDVLWKEGACNSELDYTEQTSWLLFLKYLDGLEQDKADEAKLRNIGNAGRNDGEYYTRRPLMRARVQVVRHRSGERVYDGAVGSAGLLCDSFDFMKAKPSLTTKHLATLQSRTFYGKEKK